MKSFLEDYNCITNITLSSDLLRSVKNAYKNYNQGLEMEKKEKEFRELKKQSENKEQ